MKKLLYLLAVTLILSACSKEKIDEHPDFIGFWVGVDSDSYIEITIDENGSSQYYKTNGISQTTVTGRFKIKGGDKVKIGVKGFSLDEYPAETDINDEWEMTLDGITFFSNK